MVVYQNKIIMTCTFYKKETKRILIDSCIDVRKLNDQKLCNDTNNAIKKHNDDFLESPKRSKKIIFGQF